MTVRSRTNHYRGINAHLHSDLQATRKWNRFHNYHIGQLMAALKTELLPLGYTAEMEESIQIRRVGDDLPRRPRADILIRTLQPAPSTPPALLRDARTLTLDDVMEDPEDHAHPYMAVVINDSGGEAVGWVELLSPTNKGENRDAFAYLAKRRLLLERGLVLVELDYLHETPPTFDRLPDYTLQEPNAAPYRLVIIDPRPHYAQARVYLHEFATDSPLPLATVPLSGDDTLRFDFDAVYQKTFFEGWYGADVDYRALPANFDRYSAADQLRILRRMLTVIDAAHKGHDLARAPLPLIDTPDTVAAALEVLKTFAG